MVEFFRSIFEFPHHAKATFFSANIKFFPLPSPSETCALPFNFVLEGPEKIFSMISVTQRSIHTRSSIFYYLINLCIQTLFRSNSSQIKKPSLEGRCVLKLPVSIKCHNLQSFKEVMILLCQSILEKRRISNLHGSALFTMALTLVCLSPHHKL